MRADASIDEATEQICSRDIDLLRDADLVGGKSLIRCTEFGDAMARYCMKFATMKAIQALPQRAKLSEIVSACKSSNSGSDKSSSPFLPMLRNFVKYVSGAEKKRYSRPLILQMVLSFQYRQT